MAIWIARVGVLLRPATVAVESHAYMARGLGEVEIFNNPPLIKRVEQRLNLITNTSEQFFARR